MNNPAMPERLRGAGARPASGLWRPARLLHRLRIVRLLGLLAVGPWGAGSALAAAPCGRLTLANMNWQSAEVLAQIDRIILTQGYGCEVELVAGDTVPTLTSMIERGQPDVAPEAWVNGVREAMDRAVADGRLHYAAKSLRDGGVEGWWIPKYVADKNPRIRTIADALRHPQLFPAPEDATKGAVYSCPAGWTCEILTRNLFKAYGAAAQGFVLVDTGSAAGLDGSLAKAYERRQGWLGYYWAPTALMGRYAMVRLDEGVKHDAAQWQACTAKPDCADPKPNAWVPAAVYTVVTDRFKRAGGPAYEYLHRRSWDNATVNALLAWMQAQQATGEDGARHFLKTRPDVWKPWVSAEVAARLDAAR
jgi:glycine betaine/proline transport system substrate-binding protein